MVENSDSPLYGRSFGHCIITWEIENYGRSLWQNNLKIRTPEFSIKCPKSEDTKWMLMLKTESNSKSLFEEFKVSINSKSKETNSDSLSEEPLRLNFKEYMTEHEYEKFVSMSTLIENCDIKKPKLSVKNLMLHLKRENSGRKRVWVDWMVFYIDINGKKCFLAHEDHIFDKKSSYGFHIGTLYDFEKDFDYNSRVMTIISEIIVKDADIAINFPDDENIDLHGLSEDLQWIFDQQKFCDAVIKVDGKSVKVHKAILCFHSNFFRSLFEEAADVIELPGMKYDEIVKILEYMYSYNIKDVVGRPSLATYHAAVQMILKDLVEHYAPEEQKIHTIIDIRKLGFVWPIESFSTKAINCISSPILCTGIEEAAWQIHFYPRGFDGENECTAIKVECIEGDILANMCIQCAVLRENEQFIMWKELRNSETNKAVFENEEFIEQENAIKLLNEDVLRIGLKIRSCVGKESSVVHKPHTAVLYSMKKSFENMTNNMLSLQQSNKFTDVVLKIENEEVQAHKMILSARSHLLARKLEETNSLSLPNVSPTILRILLTYMYSSILNVENIDLIIDVYKAAEEFVIPRLQYRCSRILQNSVRIDKVCCILRLADEYYDEYLKKTTLKFIQDNEYEFKEHVFDSLNRKTRLLWCGREEYSNMSEKLSPEFLVKKISVKEYSETNILTYDIEIDSDLNVKDNRAEKIVENSLIFLESTANESTRSFTSIAETVEDPNRVQEYSSTEAPKPIECERNIQSKTRFNNCDVPLKKRYRNESEFSNCTEEKIEVKEEIQNSKMGNAHDQNEVNLLKTPEKYSENKNAGEEKKYLTSCEIMNKTEMNGAGNDGSNEISSPKSL